VTDAEEQGIPALGPGLARRVWSAIAAWEVSMGRAASCRRLVASRAVGLVAIGVAKGRTRPPNLRPAFAWTVDLADGKSMAKVALHVVKVGNWYVGGP
jgi:hypothetical protein